MGYRDLMLHLSGGDDGSTAERIRYAAALAAHGGAHLTGLFTRLPLPLASHYVPPALIAGHRAEIDRAAAAARQMFEDSLQRQGIAGEWIEVEGSALDNIQVYGRSMDLVILGQPVAAKADPVAGPDHGIGQLTQDLVFALGRPVIRLPRGLAPAQRFGRLLIGWNGKKEATRAVHDALPLLRLADTVIVACVGAAGLKTTPGSELARHLARHDVAVDLVVSPERDGRAGPELLQLATQHDADLVVMGAYGYMRWRERIFGGATEAVLRQARVPVLFSH